MPLKDQFLWPRFYFIFVTFALGFFNWLAPGSFYRFTGFYLVFFLYLVTELSWNQVKVVVAGSNRLCFDYRVFDWFVFFFYQIEIGSTCSSSSDPLSDLFQQLTTTPVVAPVKPVTPILPAALPAALPAPCPAAFRPRSAKKRHVKPVGARVPIAEWLCTFQFAGTGTEMFCCCFFFVYSIRFFFLFFSTALDELWWPCPKVLEDGRVLHVFRPNADDDGLFLSGVELAQVGHAPFLFFSF